MSTLRIVDRRSEPRVEADLGLLIWSVETKEEHFMQECRARDISASGALITGIDADVRSGDVVGVRYAGKQARFRVVWIRYDAAGDKMQVALHRLPSDPCPWQHLLEEVSEPAPLTARI